MSAVSVIDNLPGLVKGEYSAPVKFGAPSKGSEYNELGYSDHLPITMVLMEE